MKHLIPSLLCLSLATAAGFAQMPEMKHVATNAQLTLQEPVQSQITVEICNPNSAPMSDAPVCVAIPSSSYKSATVTVNGKEIPSQMDDLNGDGTKDELAFVVNIAKKGRLTAEIRFSSNEAPADRYEARTHAQMWFKDNDKKRSYTEKQHIPTDTVSERVDNMYSKMMHHGPAFENELVAYRIYFDQKQSTDLYGKKVRQLELADGLWYSAEIPELLSERTFGDDIILVGKTISVGTLRGWNEAADTTGFAAVKASTEKNDRRAQDPRMVMIDPFAWRQAHIVAKGPVRTIVDMNVEGWQYQGRTLNLKSRYILYAGNRDCEIIQQFDGAAKDLEGLQDVEFVTGVMKVGSFNVDSVALAQKLYYHDAKGLCASWGKDWPDDARKLYPIMQTAALAVCVPQENVTREIESIDQFLYGVHVDDNNALRYKMAYCAATKENEMAGKPNAVVSKPWTFKSWVKWCRNWKKTQPLKLKIVQL